MKMGSAETGIHLIRTFHFQWNAGVFLVQHTRSVRSSIYFFYSLASCIPLKKKKHNMKTKMCLSISMPNQMVYSSWNKLFNEQWRNRMEKKSSALSLSVSCIAIIFNNLTKTCYICNTFYAAIQFIHKRRVLLVYGGVFQCGCAKDWPEIEANFHCHFEYLLGRPNTHMWMWIYIRMIKAAL